MGEADDETDEETDVETDEITGNLIAHHEFDDSLEDSTGSNDLTPGEESPQFTTASATGSYAVSFSNSPAALAGTRPSRPSLAALPEEGAH